MEQNETLRKSCLMMGEKLDKLSDAILASVYAPGGVVAQKAGEDFEERLGDKKN